MSTFEFKLPDIGEGTAEAEIAAWYVKVGDTVKEDQPLVDVMTDKATVELTSPVAGVVKSLSDSVGQKAAVGSVLVTIETAARAPAGKEETAPAPPAASVSRAPPRARANASPAVRRRAEALGIDLDAISGTGPEGSVTNADLDAHGNSEAAEGKTPHTGVQDIPVIGLRRQIAERMQLSKRNIPHFTYVEEVDMTALEDLRAQMNAARSAHQAKLTLLPFFMLAMAKGITAFPLVNALYDDEAGVVHRHDGVHIGMAAQTEKGLMVPVVRHVEVRDVWNLATEVARLAAAAKDGKAKREELTGSTITLTSLGVLGGIIATPVINRPEVAIVCPNKIVQRPVVQDGQIVVRKMMNLSSSFDHRVVDGADGAAFIQRLKQLLEDPPSVLAP